MSEEEGGEEEPFDDESMSHKALFSLLPWFDVIFPTLNTYLFDLGGPGYGNHDRLWFSEATFHAELYHVLRSLSAEGRSISGVKCPLRRIQSEYRAREIQFLDGSPHPRRFDLGIETFNGLGHPFTCLEVKHTRHTTNSFKPALFRKDMIRVALVDTCARYFLLCFSPSNPESIVAPNRSLGNSSNLLKDHLRNTDGFPVNSGEVAIFDNPYTSQFLVVRSEDAEFKYILGVSRVASRLVYEYHGNPTAYFLWQIEGYQFKAVIDANRPLRDFNYQQAKRNNDIQEEYWE